jgi:hypothetical protein
MSDSPKTKLTAISTYRIGLGDPLYFLNGVGGLCAKQYRVYGNLNRWVEDAPRCPLSTKKVQGPIRDDSCVGDAGMVHIGGDLRTDHVVCGVLSVQ